MLAVGRGGADQLRHYGANVFVVELVLRFASYGRHPRDFFRSGWNIFDLVIIGAVFIPGADIDTDRIIPARFLRCVTFDGLGEHAFRDERTGPDGKERPHPMNSAQAARIAAAKKGVMVVGFNFGCGSSREHAPQSIWRFGFTALVGGSFAEIFFGNSTTLGVPCVTLSKEDLAECDAFVRAKLAAAIRARGKP